MFAKILFIFTFAVFVLSSCAYNPYGLTEVPNLDHFIGKKFSEVIQPIDQLGFKKTREIAEFEELENKRPDGCVTIFGVRKKDGVIGYWRITPSPTECKVRRIPLNV